MGFIPTRNRKRWTIHVQIYVLWAAACSVIWLISVRPQSITAPDQKARQMLQQKYSGLATLLRFVLGLFMSLVLGRWWANRCYFGVVIGRSNDMANQVACFLRPGRHHEIQGHGTPDALKMKTCRVFSRYLNLALGVLSKQINQSK